MPALARIRIPALADLVEQLRYAPEEARRRQIHAAADLALHVEAGVTYPEDWIVFRITGFRPQVDDPALIVGEALLADLSSVVEHLTEYAGLAPTDVPAPSLGYAELVPRWSVSRRTIDRYRRRGLIAFRMRHGDGKTSLRFPLTWVEHFEARHAALLGRAASFGHVPDAEADEIASAARDLLSSEPTMPLTRAAGVLAGRFGRASESVRQSIIRHDRASKSPLFRPVEVLDGESRARIARAFEDGEPMASMCREFRRSRATIYRIVNERRAEVLRGAGIVAGAMPGEAAVRRLLEADPVRTGLGEAPLLETGAFVAAAAGDGPVPERVERERVRAMRVLVSRAAAAVAALPRYDPPASELDRAETDLRWAALLGIALVRMHRGLILRTVRQRMPGALESMAPPEARALLGACHRAACGALWGHDPSRGGRLAAPVSLALNRVLARDGGHVPEGTARRAAGSAALEDWRPWVTPLFAALFPFEDMRDGPAVATSDTVRVLTTRFGWGGSPPMTVEETGEALGMNPRRVRSLQRKARRG